MIALLFALIGIILCILTLFRPFIGICLYYFTALLKPEAMWPHLFNLISFNFWAIIATLLGLVFKFYSTKDDMKLISKQNVLVFLLLLLVLLSHFFSPYTLSESSGKIIMAEVMLPIFITMILFYFISTMVIIDSKKLAILVYVFIATSLLMVYWSNDRFLYYGYSIFTENGRMEGPYGQDENIFAVRVLIGLPFLMYFFISPIEKWKKVLLSISIPFFWHSIFLTGSRGGLLALLVLSLIFIAKDGTMKIKMYTSIGLLIALMTQSGLLLDRVDSTATAASITVEDDIVDPRITSWTASIEMAIDRPILGVGFERFQQATYSYGYTTPFVSHNTFLQFAANSGLIAGIIFLYLIYTSCIDYFLNKYKDKEGILYTIYKGSSLSIFSFFIASIFLNLQLYEMTYFLFLINYLCKKFILKAEQKIQ